MTAAAAGGALRVRLGWAASLQVIAALGFTSVYDGFAVVVLLVASVAVPFLLVWAGTAARLGSFVPAGAIVAVGAGAAWTVVGGSLPDTLPRLLTSARPVTVSAQLVTPVLLLVLVVSACVAGCVLAGAVAGEGVSGALAPVVGSVVLYAAAALLSAGAADHRGVAACCLLTVIVLGWSTPIVRGGARRPGALSWRPSAVAPLAATIVLALGLSTLVVGTAFDPGRHVTPPSTQLSEPSPITQFTSWEANPSAEILRTHLVGAQRLRLATLTGFTGATWTVEDRYREVGVRVSPALPPGRVRDAVHGTVRVTSLGSVWLPSVGTVTSTTVPQALADADTGTLAVVSGAHPGLTYDFTAQVDAPTSAQLQIASVVAAPPAEDVAVPGLPVEFSTFARKAILGASTPLEEALALEHAVSTGRSLVTDAPTGSSYSRLATFLFSPAGTAGAQAGSAEQFATAFAVLARAVGLPTRVVVGFEVPAANANGTSVVYGRDATVWPEVYFAGAGWVPFAPTPGVAGGAGDTDRDSVLQKVASNAASQAPVRAGAQAVLPRLTVPPPPARKRAVPAAGTRWWVVSAVVFGSLVVLLLVTVWVLRRVRSWRHRRRGVVGAWSEFVDLLVLVGHGPRPDEAAPEIARRFDLAHPQAGVRASVLAEDADRAAFGPRARGAADGRPEVWRDLRVLRRRVVGSASIRRRLMMPVDPRPLRRSRNRNSG